MTITKITQGRVSWINILDPDAADIQQLSGLYPQFHPLNLQDCLTEREIPKLDHYDQYLFLVLQLPVPDGRQGIFRPAEVDVFITKGTLITSHRGDLQPLNDLFAQAQSDPRERQALMGAGASPLLHKIVEELVSACYPVLQAKLNALHHIECNLFNDDTRHLLNEIALVRRDIIALKHILSPQIAVLEKLGAGSWSFIHEDLDFYWSDVIDHLNQLCSMLEESREVISGLSETADTLASHRIDEIIRLLTLVNMFTLPLTLLASIFGMNIVLPYSQHPRLFFVLIGLALALVILLVWYLRKRRWF